MLQKIKNDSDLILYLHTRLEDAGLEVKVAESVREDELAAISIENQLLQKPILFQNRLYQIKFFESNGIQICKSYICKEQTDMVPLK